MIKMFINEYVKHSQLGTRITPNCVDLQFLLPRFECKSEDIYSVQGRYADGTNVPPFSAQFCRVPSQEHIYALACEDGEIIFMNSDLPAKKSCIKHWSAHSNAVFDVCWLKHSSQLITASGDQTAALWDTTTLQRISTFKGHASSVKTLSLLPGNESVFVTGSRDGNILLWDARTPSDPHHKSVGILSGAHNGADPGRKRKRLRKGTAPAVADPLNSITCVLFQDSNTFLSTGASDWSIKGWDMRSLQSNSAHNAPVPLINIKNSIENHKAHGYTSLVLNPNGKSFFANCTDGTISQYEVSSHLPQLLSTYHGHQVGTFFVKMDVSCDGQFIVSGASDNKAYIWKVSKPGVPLVSLEGHDQEVTAVAWHPRTVTKLVTCGDDEQVFHWSIGYGDHLPPRNDGSTQVVGRSLIINPEAVRLPGHRHLQTPLSYTTPSSRRSTDINHSPAGKGPTVLPPLTQWFTPKSKVTTTQEMTPKPTSIAALDVLTPVKVTQRLAFRDLNNTGERCERRVTVSGLAATRRAINFGSQNDLRTHHSSKKAKLCTSSRNYSIKNFFQAEPKTPT